MSPGKSSIWEVNNTNSKAEQLSLTSFSQAITSRFNLWLSRIVERDTFDEWLLK